MTITGFVVYVDDQTSPNELAKLRTTLFQIKGVEAVMDIKQPFEIYGLRTACENEVARKLLAAIPQ